MYEKIVGYLKAQKNKEISLLELTNMAPANTDYTDFANTIKVLEAQNILKPMKSHKTNNKSIPLYNTYRINQSYFKDQIMDQIQTFRLKMHQDIYLDHYYSLKEEEWTRDLPYIERIDQYMKANGLPDTEASAAERSYKIAGDEKWIDEKGGKALLQRLQLWEQLKVSYNVDPLMIVINPLKINNMEHMHLVVENKATFYELLQGIKNTDFTSLIYGVGWKIVSNIHMLEKQLGLMDQKHSIFYFGDLDHEGISIWNTLNEKRAVLLAVEFYRALLQKDSTEGKHNQKENLEAIEKFVQAFTPSEGIKIKDLLKSKQYYPQEGLQRKELMDIWINMISNLD